MYYSIYPKLRALYSYFPSGDDYMELIEVKGLSGFKKSLEDLALMERFPMKDTNIERHFRFLPFDVTKNIFSRLNGNSRKFFKGFFMKYELKDIKSALHGGRGQFLIFKEKETFTTEEIGKYLQGSQWGEIWNKSTKRYDDTGNILDLETPLDRHYYLNLINSVPLLPSSEEKEMYDFLICYVNIINRNWIFRLREFYHMEQFEITQMLIPEGEAYKKFPDIKGLNRHKSNERIFEFSYREFKTKMFTMSSIIAFILLLEITADKIMNIYYSKIINIKPERTSELTGMK